MIRDYHMHPQIITKPELFAQFVETARKNGIEEICITDHMPLIGSSLKDRLPAGSVREYCETAKRLKEQYRDVLSVKIGIEIDYHPTVTDQIRRVLDEGEFDWILGSSHLHALPGQDIVKSSKTRTKYAMKMFENTAAAAESGWFTAIAAATRTVSDPWETSGTTGRFCRHSRKKTFSRLQVSGGTA